MRARERPHWVELGVRCDATLHDLDRFLRAVWLECCSHVSHFEIGDDVYSVMVPMPGDPWRFEPMDEREARWRHMGETVNAAIPPLARFEYEHDYGSPTELDLPPGWRDWENNDRRLWLRWDRDFWSLLVDRVTNYTDLRSSSRGGT